MPQTYIYSITTAFALVMIEESLAAYRSHLDGSAIATLILVILAVPAKMWCRVKTGGRASLGWDDALSVVALLWANGFFWITMIGM